MRPGAPGPWRQDEFDRFNQGVIDACRRLRDELGSTWDIYTEFSALYGHPDLDRYVADPDGYR